MKSEKHSGDEKLIIPQKQIIKPVSAVTQDEAQITMQLAVEQQCKVLLDVCRGPSNLLRALASVYMKQCNAMLEPPKKTTMIYGADGNKIPIVQETHDSLWKPSSHSRVQAAAFQAISHMLTFTADRITALFKKREGEASDKEAVAEKPAVEPTGKLSKKTSAAILNAANEAKPKV